MVVLNAQEQKADRRTPSERASGGGPNLLDRLSPPLRSRHDYGRTKRSYCRRVIGPLMLAAVVGACARVESYKDILERKYDAPLERLDVISFSPTTKVLWFDWQRKWWGSLNVIETTQDGKPLYWYDFLDAPTAQSIESVRVVTLSGQKYLEVIDCTHMGNGMLYLYEIRPGFVRLKVKVRVIANLSVHFEPRVANVSYRDLDQDGDDDVVVDASCLKGQVNVGKYHREYLFQAGSFREQKEKRLGRKELMDW